MMQEKYRQKYRGFVGVSLGGIGWNGQTRNKKASNHNDYWLL